MVRHLALELASTIRHDGEGGVADDLESVEGVTRWIRAQAELLPEGITGITGGATPEFRADDELRGEVVALRQAVRALFAQAVSPAPASSADAHCLIATDQALARLNAAAAAEPVTPQLAWPHDEFPAASLRPAAEREPRVRLSAALARAAIDFLAGPERERLRSCAAPRCVRYFVKRHGRQEWCKPSCGNRARVARHYRRQREAPAESS
ncbi:CGNR zinc finger domain-containing protein [Streptomyces sp. NPDC021622]|uniref:CGNR zinc finger domain-containing protein n=1 Tax=Streptomyces sp. NPDC021622 TaxID=3155013 RepID=UPI0033EC0896